MVKSESYSVKREIMKALMGLMAEKNYMEITVTDIVKKAGVARASFYRNFNTINDVLDAIVEEVSDEVIEDIFPTLYSSETRKWREFLFNHFYRFLRRQKEMEGIRFENMSVIFTCMDNKIQQKETALLNGTIRDKYLAVGKMGLIHNITKRWIDTGEKETPEEMIDYIMSFITLF